MGTWQNHASSDSPDPSTILKELMVIGEQSLAGLYVSQLWYLPAMYLLILRKGITYQCNFVHLISKAWLKLYRLHSTIHIGDIDKIIGNLNYEFAIFSNFRIYIPTCIFVVDRKCKGFLR